MWCVRASVYGWCIWCLLSHHTHLYMYILVYYHSRTCIINRIYFTSCWRLSSSLYLAAHVRCFFFFDRRHIVTPSEPCFFCALSRVCVCVHKCVIVLAANAAAVAATKRHFTASGFIGIRMNVYTSTYDYFLCCAVRWEYVLCLHISFVRAALTHMCRSSTYPHCRLCVAVCCRRRRRICDPREYNAASTQWSCCALRFAFVIK